MAAPVIPATGKSIVLSYDENDRDYPIIGVRRDPTAGLGQTPPEMFSSHPDEEKYPDHVFTGVTVKEPDSESYWVYRILPGPVTTGQHTDPETGILQVFNQHDAKANTEDGTPLTTITPTDAAIDRIITTPIPTTALDAFSLGFPDYMGIPLPDELIGIEVIWEKSQGDGGYSETGSGAASGAEINLTLSTNGSGQASASVVPELIPTYAPSRGMNVPVMQYFFYLPQPNTHATLLAKMLTLSSATFSVQSIVAGAVSATAHGLSIGEKFQFRTLTGATGANLAINTTYFVKTTPSDDSFTYALTLGGAAVTTGAATGGTAIPVIQAWPNFRPIEDTIILKGQKASASLKAKGDSHLSVSSSTASTSNTTGTGTDGDVSSSIRAEKLKPAIHAAITFTGLTSDSLDVGLTATAVITGSSGGFPDSGDTITGTVHAEGSVYPTSLGATPVPTIPTVGKYFMKPSIDLSKYTGYSVVRCIVVDFAFV